jgi:hypothetical protein
LVATFCRLRDAEGNAILVSGRFLRERHDHAELAGIVTGRGIVTLHLEIEADSSPCGQARESAAEFQRLWPRTRYCPRWIIVCLSGIKQIRNGLILNGCIVRCYPRGPRAQKHTNRCAMPSSQARITDCSGEIQRAQEESKLVIRMRETEARIEVDVMGATAFQETEGVHFELSLLR